MSERIKKIDLEVSNNISNELYNVVKSDVPTVDFIVNRYLDKETADQYAKKIKKQLKKQIKATEKLKETILELSYLYDVNDEVILKDPIRRAVIVKRLPVDQIRYDKKKYGVLFEFDRAYSAYKCGQLKAEDINCPVFVREDEIEPYPGTQEHIKRLTSAYLDLRKKEGI